MLKRGTQVAYIPYHTNGNITHPDVEYGFVTSVDEAQGIAWCRYWLKGRDGILRTKANSEATPIGCLQEKESVSQLWVENVLEVYC